LEEVGFPSIVAGYISNSYGINCCLAEEHDPAWLLLKLPSRCIDFGGNENVTFDVRLSGL